jgi:2-(1,2-epoxy-1,2-dihydrophenyl)acetyl-CoA isomerase
VAEARAVTSPVVLESFAEGVLTLTLNRPEKLNALNVELGAGLAAAMDRAGADPRVRAVVLTGAGRAFCAGGDLGAIRAARDAGRVAELEPLLRAGAQLILRMRTMETPIIAAVNGPAAGGGMNVALGCDVRIASEQASFGQSFAKVGLFPDYGGTYLLPRLVGPARAAEMFWLADMIPAREAERLGIVNRVVPHEQLAAEAHALAVRVAAAPPLAVRALKPALLGAGRAVLERALEFEVQQQMKCFFSEDCAEGLRAFFEKRPPLFRGN